MRIFTLRNGFIVAALSSVLVLPLSARRDCAIAADYPIAPAQPAAAPHLPDLDPAAFAPAADPAAAPTPPAAARSPRVLAPTATSTTTLNDQTDLAVTVYNSELALVRDVRQITLPAGESQLRFMDIASSVNPATVHFRSLTDPATVNILEQNYEFDLLDPTKLLQKYVGREVTLVRPKMDAGSTQFDEVKATLLSFNDAPVWKIGNEIVTGLSYESIRFPQLPENLFERPTLLWTVQNGGARSQKIEASYLTGNLSWSADYVLNVAKDETSAGLDGWITLKNESGTAFQNARLQLVAGDLNRVVTKVGAYSALASAMDRLEAAPPPVSEENFSEYHLYTLNRRTSVLNKETKQVSLLDAPRLPLQKAYVVDGRDFYYRSASPGASTKDPVEVYYRFKNDDKSGLGMPLPAGTIRVYQADSTGGSLFAGEDHIDHTPKDESIDLHIGNAFDVVAERKQTDYKKLSDRQYEMEYEITLRNHKDIPITVEVNEPIGGSWEILNSTYKFTKTAAFAAQFNVPVDKNGASVLKYRIRVRY